ncbi:LysR substrate-binding domain-containing protein [Sorangium sp. So ce513]|uniref:LysR substrate-binding domain-containing protein n=1 Tax=Sorangium sp. So ce513 TaxID=3133315 RepID=UPI003F5D6710
MRARVCEGATSLHLGKSVDSPTARHAASSCATNARPRTPEDLVRHRAIRQRLIATGVVYRWELERRGKTITVDVPGGIVVDEIGLMVALACAGAGLAYVPDQAIERDLSEGRLERVLEAFITKGPGFCLYFPARTQEQPKLRALIETVTRFRAQEARREAAGSRPPRPARRR